MLIPKLDLEATKKNQQEDEVDSHPEIAKVEEMLFNIIEKLEEIEESVK